MALIKLRFASLLMIGLLGACATPLRINIPTLRFESPELEGTARNAAFAFGLQSYVEAELSRDTQTVPVHAEATTFHQYFMDKENTGLFDAMASVFTDYSYLYLKFAYAFEMPIELSYRFPDRLGLKTQLIGNRAGEAKKGDISLALTTSFASRSSETSYGASPSTTLTDTSITMSRTIFDVAAIVGMRVSDKVLLYGGPFILYTPYKVDQILNTTTDSISTQGQVSTYGGNLGLQFRGESGFSIKFEVVVNRIEGYRAQDDFVNGGLVISKAF